MGFGLLHIFNKLTSSYICTTCDCCKENEESDFVMVMRKESNS